MTFAPFMDIIRLHLSRLLLSNLVLVTVVTATHHGSLLLPTGDDIFPAAIYTLEPVALRPEVPPTLKSPESLHTVTPPRVPSLVAPPLASNNNLVKGYYVKHADIQPSKSTPDLFEISDHTFTGSPTTISGLAASSNYGDVFFSPAAAYANTLFFPSLASVMGAADASAIPFSPTFLHQQQTPSQPGQHYPILLPATTSSATLTFDPAAYRAYYDPTPAATLIGQSSNFFGTEQQRPASSPSYGVLEPRPSYSPAFADAAFVYPRSPSTAYQFVHYDGAPDQHYWPQLPSIDVKQNYLSPPAFKRPPVDTSKQYYYWLPNDLSGRFKKPTTVAESKNMDNREGGLIHLPRDTDSATSHVNDHLSNDAPIQQPLRPGDGNLFGRTGLHSVRTNSRGTGARSHFVLQTRSPVAGAFIKEGIADALGFAVPPAEAVEVMFKSAKGIVLFGNELSPSQANDEPPFVRWPNNHRSLYTLMMLDLDAPTAVNPYQRPLIHWIIVNIPGNLYWLGKTLVKYIGPAPLPASGEHRYVFLVYEQPEFINADEPVIPRNEMTARSNFRLSDFVVKYNLIGPLAGNFFHSSHEKAKPGKGSINVGKIERGISTSASLPTVRNVAQAPPYSNNNNANSASVGNLSPQFETQQKQQPNAGNFGSSGEFNAAADGYYLPSPAIDTQNVGSSAADGLHPNYYYGRSLKSRQQDINKDSWRHDTFAVDASKSSEYDQKPALQGSASLQAALLAKNLGEINSDGRRIPVTA